VTGNINSTGTDSDYATVKYDTDGNQIWVAMYKGSANGGGGASAIAIDSHENVYVTGGTSGIGTVGDYATIKYNQSTLTYVDVDADGYTSDVDCNDSNPAIHPAPPNSVTT